MAFLLLFGLRKRNHFGLRKRTAWAPSLRDCNHQDEMTSSKQGGQIPRIPVMEAGQEEQNAGQTISDQEVTWRPWEGPSQIPRSKAQIRIERPPLWVLFLYILYMKPSFSFPVRLWQSRSHLSAFSCLQREDPYGVHPPCPHLHYLASCPVRANLRPESP